MNLSVVQGSWWRLGVVELLHVDKYIGAGRCPLSARTSCTSQAVSTGVCQVGACGFLYLRKAKAYLMVFKDFYLFDFSLPWAV